MPKLSCTCPERSSCCHVLAVQSINGLDISNSYKIPNLTSLTISKNSGLTGRKKKGHLVNSIDPSSNTISTSTQSDVRCLLSDLLLDKRDEILDSLIDEKSNFQFHFFSYISLNTRKKILQ